MRLNVSAVAAGVVAMAASTVVARPPNVVVIISDDQGYGDCSAYPTHSKDVSTPNLDRIGNGGAVFTAGYVSAPVCSPSRTGLLTGLYQQRIDKAAGWNTTLPASVKTIAERMKAAQYATMQIGKNDFGHLLDDPKDRRYPFNHGYDKHLGFEGHAHDFFLLTKEIERLAEDPHEPSANVGPLDTEKGPGTAEFKTGYTTEIFTDAAIDFVKANKDRPFLLTVAHNAVHDTVQQVPKKYLEKFGLPGIPMYEPSMGSYTKYYNRFNRIGEVNDADMRKYYLANLACLDDNVGRLLDAIEAQGLTNDTLVVFVADNGGSPGTGGSNVPLRGAKYGLFEGGIRVPFMMRYPGKVKPGTVVAEPVSTLDIVPTALEAAGVNGDDTLDGISLLKRATGGSGDDLAGRTLFWKFQQHWAVRRGDWKLVRTNPTKSGGTVASWIIDGPPPAEGQGKPRLYNLKDDLAEQKDVIADHPDVVKDLRAAWEAWEAEHGKLGEARQGE